MRHKEIFIYSDYYKTFYSFKKEVDFSLSEIASALELSGLKNILRSTVLNMLNNTIVIPNRLVFSIAPDFDINELLKFKPKVNINAKC